MKTIVKGKNISYHYIANCIEDFDKRASFYVSYHTDIIDTPIYFESDKLDHILNVGDHFEGNLIEKVDVNKDNQIIYYTDKIIFKDQNYKDKEKARKELEKMKLEYKKENKKWFQFWNKIRNQLGLGKEY